MTVEDVLRVLVIVLAVLLVSSCGGGDDDAGADDADAQTTTAAPASPSSGSGLSPEESTSVVSQLELVESAYLGGDRDGARTYLERASTAWSEVADRVPTDVAYQVELQLGTLGDAIDGESPPVAIQGAVGMLTEQLAPASSATTVAG
jgi:hypothetical protein